MKKHKVALVGGGSGGHIMPLFAIAKQLSKLDKDVEIIYITERNGKFNYLFKDAGYPVKKVYAGKFRRYHGVSKIRQILDIKTVGQNIFDIFKIFVGTIESLIMLVSNRPDVLFAKGGYVSLPVGIAARILRIKYITHDSDRSPSLTNKLIGKGARWNLLGFEQLSSVYDPGRTKVVGIPVNKKFSPIDEKQKSSLKSDLDIPKDAFLLLIIGGSIGADRLNYAVSKAVDKLLDSNKDLYVIHQTGLNQNNYYDNKISRLKTIDFIEDVSKYSGAADLVISRAGATAIAEFASQNKPLILVPNPNLTGGHQVENAELLADSNACISIEESPQLDKEIIDSVTNLINDKTKLKKMEKEIDQFSSYKSANEVAKIIVEEFGVV